MGLLPSVVNQPSVRTADGFPASNSRHDPSGITYRGHVGFGVHPACRGICRRPMPLNPRLHDGLNLRPQLLGRRRKPSERHVMLDADVAPGPHTDQGRLDGVEAIDNCHGLDQHERPRRSQDDRKRRLYPRPPHGGRAFSHHIFCGPRWHGASRVFRGRRGRGFHDRASSVRRSRPGRPPASAVPARPTTPPAAARRQLSCPCGL